MVVQASYPSDPRVRREAEALEDSGYEVDVLCRPSGNQPKVEKFGNITAYRVTPAPSQESLIKWIYFSSKFFIKTFWKIQLLYRKRKYSVIHIHNLPDFLVFVAFFQKLYGIPIFLDLHDLSVELFRVKWQNKRLAFLLPVVKMIEHLSCRFADHIITTSDGFVDCLVSRGVPKDKITLLYNTPRGKYFYFNDKRKYSIIKNNAKLFYHGTVADRFGVDTVIKALPLINQSIPGTQLIIFGRLHKQYEEKLNQLAQELKVKQSLILNKPISIDKVLNEINKADIGLVPYSRNDFMELALSTKGFEYAMSGIPIIATALKPMKRIFDETCVTYFSPSDPNDLASKVIYLCNNPETRKQNVSSTNSAISHISWALMEKVYSDLIERFLGES